MAKIKREKLSVYDDFECRGNTTCIDSCCFAWDLPMDSETVEYYLNYEGEYGDFLRQNMFQDEKGGWYIRQKEHGRCPFLTSEKLCDVRLHAGEKAQIKICDIYPRERNITVGDYRQDRVLLACSEVARLLYTQTGDRLESVITFEESTAEVSEELKSRTESLLAFRDGMVEGLQNGSFDKSLFESYETAAELEKLLDDALYFEGHEASEEVFRRVRSILPRVDELRTGFYDATKEAKTWLRKTAAYFAHRQLLDTIQDGSIQGPLLSVFRSVHLLELICLEEFDKKGTFDVEDMIFSAHIFGLIFEVSMHNILLLKQIRNTAKDEEYPEGENSELRPMLYP